MDPLTALPAPLRRFLDDERGAAAPSAFLLTLVLLGLCATLLDLYSLSSTRNWADRACLDASLRAVSVSRDLSSYVDTGTVRLDPVLAAAEAYAAVDELAAARGLSPTDYSVDVRVLELGGAVPGFPPLARASVLSRDFASAEPAVGVYLEVRANTTFMRALGLGDFSGVHAFASSSLSARPN